MRTYICTNFDDHGHGLDVAVILAENRSQARELLDAKLKEFYGAAAFYSEPNLWELDAGPEGVCELVNGGDCD